MQQGIQRPKASDRHCSPNSGAALHSGTVADKEQYWHASDCRGTAEGVQWGHIVPLLSKEGESCRNRSEKGPVLALHTVAMAAAGPGVDEVHEGVKTVRRVYDLPCDKPGWRFSAPYIRAMKQSRTASSSTSSYSCQGAATGVE